MSDKDDDELIRQYCSGNAAAFDQLYARYRLAVFNYISRQVHPRSQAEDIFQDVWLRVVRSLDRYESNGPFAAWLFTIARNRLTDYWRANKPEMLEENDEHEDQHPSPDHLHFIRSCIERLVELLNKLKPEQRDAFILQQESGLTLEQIAQVAACGRETIKSRLRYAMQKLRKGLEGCDES